MTGILWFACVALVTASPLSAQEPKTLNAGPLRLEIYASARTATLFHVVDQLSLWSEFCHRQYDEEFQRRDGGYSQPDRDLLAKHVAVRQAHGWGEGLEQTFYTPSGLETALKSGVAAGLLTGEQAAIEREVLTHFAPRIEALMERQSAVVEAFAQRLVAEQANLREVALKLSRFCGGSKVTVPVYLLANPSADTCGGGFNGGRLTWEVPSGRDVYHSFLHEVFHAFLKTHKSEFEKAVRDVPNLNTMILNEGVVYALSPGLLHSDGSGDPLLKAVRDDIAANKPFTDNLTCFRRFGLALRPLLRDALEDRRQTLATFLPRAVDAWRVVAELELAAADGNDASQTSWFSAGPAWRELNGVAASCGCSLNSFNHTPQYYKTILANSRPGSTIVLLFALDHRDKHMPKEYQDLLPVPWDQLEATLAEGKTVECAGKARERKIVLLAAPTELQLNELVHSTKLLP